MTAAAALTEDERSLMAWLTIRSVSEQLGWTEDAASDALDDLAGRGVVRFLWDNVDVQLIVDDYVLVHATREWLAAAILAAHPAPDDASELLDPPPG